MNLSKHVFNFCFQYNEYRNSGTDLSLNDSTIQLGMESTNMHIENVINSYSTDHYLMRMNSNFSINFTKQLTHLHGTLS